MTIEVLAGMIVPFLGTTAGAALALFMKKGISQAVSGIINGFAAGVMFAASVWSLIIPSVEMTESSGALAFLPTVVGIVTGMAALYFLDLALPEGGRSNKLLMTAVTAHNVPEGMAVGAILAGLIAGGEGITIASAMSLCVGIALQNIPEGAIIGLAYLGGGERRMKSFAMGTISGVVEPIAALVTIALYAVAVAILPYLLSFAAGCMIYVAAKELCPELGKYGAMGLCAGFVLMMALDLAL